MGWTTRSGYVPHQLNGRRTDVAIAGVTPPTCWPQVLCRDFPTELASKGLGRVPPQSKASSTGVWAFPTLPEQPARDACRGWTDAADPGRKSHRSEAHLLSS